jgi:hypothetical protein
MWSDVPRDFAAATADASPWWGVPVIAGIFTILGASLSQIVTWLLDRARARRDARTRWHSDRLDAYAATLLALDRIFTRLLEDETALGPQQVFDAVEPHATRARLLAGPAVEAKIWSTITGLAEVADMVAHRARRPSPDQPARRQQRPRTEQLAGRIGRG